MNVTKPIAFCHLSYGGTTLNCALYIFFCICICLGNFIQKAKQQEPMTTPVDDFICDCPIYHLCCAHFSWRNSLNRYNVSRTSWNVSRFVDTSFWPFCYSPFTLIYFLVLHANNKLNKYFFILFSVIDLNSDEFFVWAVHARTNHFNINNFDCDQWGCERLLLLLKINSQDWQWLIWVSPFYWLCCTTHTISYIQLYRYRKKMFCLWCSFISIVHWPM